MADKSSQLIVEALARAVLEPEGASLYASRQDSGLFPATAAARQAAEACKQEGYVAIVRTEPAGKQMKEICRITEKGLEYLLREANPLHLFEDFVRALEARQTQLAEIVAVAQSTQAGVERLRDVVERALEKFLHWKHTGQENAVPINGRPDWRDEVVRLLSNWHGYGAGGDCPLPHLFRELSQCHPALTIGAFHDGLRQLHAQERIYLHPWTGPLYDMPEPNYALMIGHLLVYYASLR